MILFNPQRPTHVTSIARVTALDSFRFGPGAIADHLISAGGVLFGKGQMSTPRWLEADATRSYGAMAEPCNCLEKFPDPGIVIDDYLHGETLIEA